MEQGFQQLSLVLKLTKGEGALEEAQEKAQLVGRALEDWIDASVGAFWAMGDICSTEPSPCPSLVKCTESSWSSLSPDPKSELGAVKSNGRIR